ncbi:unnamed protein product [Phytophthora fragariaefolia]|uniref:Unnamed protein product n=1 Tax=Phytophthora fragariaefolia TaxID=1490495 RepID=A0A9W6U7L3_9STRA|nr:unnamed protein product [Phytophthora fragariaefolia]
MPLAPAIKSLLEAALRPLLAQLQEAKAREDQDSAARPLLALRLKEKVAECLREWIAEPVHGFVLRKEHVVNGMRLDDLVATPAGAGYLRGYRGVDGFCTVVYPWGHGFVHVKDVEKVQQALQKHLKKRTYNEYVALEHQQLFEQIEGLLENLPPAPQEGKGAAKEGQVDVEEYKELLKSLEEEVSDVVDGCVGLVKELRRAHLPKEPEHKIMRTEKDDDMPAAEADQRSNDESPGQENKEQEEQEIQGEQEEQEEQGEQEQRLEAQKELPPDVSEHKEENEMEGS